MKRFHALLLSVLALVACSAKPQAQDTPGVRLVQTIPLPNVEGRIDHLAVDLARHRLFVAALGNNTLEVLDLSAGSRVASLEGLSEPQGVAYLRDADRVFVAGGGDGTCKAFDGATLELGRSLRLGDDADNVRYDAPAGCLYVGFGEGALGILDAKKGESVGSIELAGHPESFQLERSGSRIFVNVPTAGHIAVVDRQRRAVVATWPLGALRANFPMALDEPHHRLFVGTRQPARLVVLDATSGTTVAVLECAGDADDIFYDAARKRIYVACGEGFLDVFEQVDSDHYRETSKVPTAPGARTALFVPELSRLYVAVPHRASQQAAIWVYELIPRTDGQPKS